MANTSALFISPEGTEIEEALLDAGEALLSFAPEPGERHSFESLGVDGW